MITKTFICDLCKKSVGEKELIPLSTTATLPKGNYTAQFTVKKDVCMPCLRAKGILDLPATGPDAEVIENNSKAFEKIFVEMLETLGVQFVE